MAIENGYTNGLGSGRPVEKGVRLDEQSPFSALRSGAEQLRKICLMARDAAPTPDIKHEWNGMAVAHGQWHTILDRFVKGEMPAFREVFNPQLIANALKQQLDQMQAVVDSVREHAEKNGNGPLDTEALLSQDEQDG